MKALHEKMHRGMNLTIMDENEDEGEEGQVDQEEKQEEVLNIEEERIFKAITNIGKRPKFNVPMFLRNFNLEELINWVNELEEYFEYEQIEDLNRVMFAKVKLKGHAKIQWQEVQLEWNRRVKEKITKWDRMISKLK